MTATEIRLRREEWLARWAKQWSAIADKITQPLTDRAFEIMFGPKRKRWDQYSAYHRRQLKKWRKRQKNIEIIARGLSSALLTPDVNWWRL